MCLTSISIHAPHEGERRQAADMSKGDKYFNPRSPRGGATVGRQVAMVARRISIHAPHEGERLSTLISILSMIIVFQSTLPTRGSDPPPIMAKSTIRAFQSTLPTRGSDLNIPGQLHFLLRFQSTLPTRGSDSMGKYAQHSNRISIHAPHEGERHRAGISLPQINRFQSTLPTRGSDQEQVLSL